MKVLVVGILNRLVKPYVSLAQTVIRFSCKFGSGIGLPNQMVSSAQTISKLVTALLLSIHGVSH